MGVEVGLDVDEGSRQINPNQASDVQEGLLFALEVVLVLGMTGGDVIE